MGRTLDLRWEKKQLKKGPGKLNSFGMNQNVPKSIDIKFLGDVVSAIRVLEGQIEFVFGRQDIQTMVAAMSWTILGSTTAVDVDIDVLLQSVGIFETIVFGSTVGDEPRHLFGLVGCKVGCDWFPPDLVVEVNPFFVGCDQLTIRLVSGRPVEHVLFSDVLSV